MREPLPFGYKTVVALAGLASFNGLFSACVLAASNAGDGHVLLSGVLGIMLLACAIGLAFRLRVARWLLLMLDFTLGLPVTALLTISAVSMAISGEAYSRPLTTMVFVVLGGASLAACLFVAYYLTFGPGGRLFRRGPRAGLGPPMSQA